MTARMDSDILSAADQRLIAALQCDGRVTAEKMAHVLGLSVRDVSRRLRSLTAGGIVRILGQQVASRSTGAMLLRVRVLRGKLDVITAALAARDDIPFIDVSAAGDEISAVLLTDSEPRSRLVFQQLPATTAVTSVSAQTVLHVFALAGDWRLDVLTETERAALTPAAPPSPVGPAASFDELDEAIATALEEDGRVPASTVARRIGQSESTVRRRLASLLSSGSLTTQVAVDPHRLGLSVDANVWLEVPPDHLDAAGRSLAGHPAVHGVLATTGRANLCVALWLRDTEALYRFLSHDLAGHSITAAETILVGEAVKRPGHVSRSGPLRRR